MPMSNRTPELIRRDAHARVSEVVGSLAVPPGCALVATGSLARGELTAYSDCDVFLLIDDNRSGSPTAEDIDSMWYPFWDAKLSLDYSVRTLKETISVMGEDPRVAFAVLDMAFLGGDEDFFAAARSEILRAWRRLVAKNFDAVVDQIHHRWKNTGSVADMTSPDLKHGRGGLRDGELLRGLALGQLCDAGDICKQRQLLVDVRALLHESAGRPRDILDPEFAAEIAPLLQMRDRFELSHAVATSARAIDQAVQRALATARDVIPRHRSLLLRTKRRVPLDVDVMLVEDLVGLADKPDFSDPELPLRMAAAAARAKKRLSAEAVQRLAKNWQPEAMLWTASMRANLCRVLGAGEQVADLIDTLYAAGLWSKYVPAWDAIAGVLPAEPSHVRSIDQHTLEALRLVAPATTTVGRPDLLLLSVLFHDLAKGGSVPHEAAGAELASAHMEVMGFREDERRVVACVVGEHSLVSRLAARTDPTSEEAVGSIVEAMGGPVAIEILGPLTRADAQATGPGVWSGALEYAVGAAIPAALARVRGNTWAEDSERAEDSLSWKGPADELCALLDFLDRSAWRVASFAFRRSGLIEAEFRAKSLIGETWDSAAVEQSIRHQMRNSRRPYVEAPTALKATNIDWQEGRATIKLASLETNFLKAFVRCESVEVLDAKDLGAAALFTVEVARGSEALVSETLGAQSRT